MMTTGYNWEQMDKDDAAERERRAGYRAKDYTGEKCENCGRVRVMNCDNGKHVCEKCAWNADTHEYEAGYDLG
jgi:uncharacterized OB-fold protein